MLTIILIITALLVGIAIFSFILIKIAIIITATAIGAIYFGTYFLLSETLGASTGVTIFGTIIIGTILVRIFIQLFGDIEKSNNYQQQTPQKKSWESLIKEKNESEIARIKYNNEKYK